MADLGLCFYMLLKKFEKFQGDFGSNAVVWMSEIGKLSWSVLLLAAVPVGLDRMIIVCQWQISDLSQFDGKHACSKLIIPHLICHVFLMLFVR